MRPFFAPLAAAGLLSLSAAFACTGNEGGDNPFGLSAGTGGATASADDAAPDDGDGTADATVSDGASGANDGTATASNDDGSAGTGDDNDDGTGDGNGTGNDTGNDTGGDTDGASESGDGSTGGGVLSEDPFDPLACDGLAWTAGDASDQLGGMAREVLAEATIVVRSRTCPGGVCGEWGPSEDWLIHYLTWSGGVSTSYIDLPADMRLVLFDDNGTPRLSMQHVTFDAGNYPDLDGVLYDFPPSAVGYPHLRAFNEFPENPFHYTDLDYQVSEDELVLGAGCAVWTAFPFGAGTPHTEQYGVVFHW
ncbi:MAG: hypothetical protein AAF721_31395 [Myxococcota bacterium]